MVCSLKVHPIVLQIVFLWSSFMFCTALRRLCELNPQNLTKKKLPSGISISIRFKTSLSRFCFLFFFVFSFFFSSLPPLTPQRRRRTNGVGHLRREAAPAVGKVGHGDAARRATRWREKFFFLGHVVRSRCTHVVHVHCWNWRDGVP